MSGHVIARRRCVIYHFIHSSSTRGVLLSSGLLSHKRVHGADGARWTFAVKSAGNRLVLAGSCTESGRLEIEQFSGHIT